MNEIAIANKKYILQCSITRYMVQFQTQVGRGFNYNKALEKAKTALEQITAELRQRGFENACQHCAVTEGVESYAINDMPAFLCAPCCNNRLEAQAEKKQEVARKKENLIGGIAGAFLGSILGAICIVLLGQIGYVASLSGVVMGVCALKGYEMLGGKLSIKGIIISVLLMVVMVYIGQRFDYAIEIAKVFKVDVITGFRLVPAFLTEGAIETASYYANLAMLYLFTALGGGSTVGNALKNLKAGQRADTVYRLETKG